MKVLLIAPTFQYTIEYPSFMAVSDFACGFAYIASALKAAGHQVVGLNPNNAPGYPSASHMIHDKIAQSVAGSKPDLIGIGGICTDFPFLYDALRIIRHYAPATPVVMGGSIITYDHEFVHSALKPDYSLAGEAEETVVMLADAIENSGDLNAIPNLGYWRDDQAVFTQKDLSFGGDLNARPFPDYSIFDIDDMLDNCSWAARYVYRFTRSTPRVMSITCARSCPFTCTFCLHGREGRAKYRVRTTENIMEEIKVLYDQYHFNILIILDELFATSKQRLKEFCNVMIEHREKYGWDFDWLFQTHANAKLDLEAIKMAKRAGCTYFSYGMESASPTVLKSMKKRTHPDQLSAAIALAEQAEIGFGGNFIFGDPAETPETISETLTFYQKYCADIHCFVCEVRPYPGSTLYSVCQERGILPDKLTFYKNIDRFTFNMTQMPDAQWQSYLKDIFALTTFPFCVTVNAKRIIGKATRTKITLRGERQVWELFADCPYCKREFSYPELVEAEKVVANGRQVLTGCPKCYKRLRINIPVEKDKGLLLQVEVEATQGDTLSTENHQWPKEVIDGLQQAEADFLKGDLPAARDALREALVIAPRDAQLIVAYGNIVLRLGDTEGARREFVKATMLAPDHAPAHLNLAGVLLILGRREDAEASVRRALALNPTDADALKLLGRLCLERGRYADGVRAYEDAVQHTPHDVEALLGLAKCAIETGDLTAARTMCKRVLQIEPGNQNATGLLASLAPSRKDAMSARLASKRDEKGRCGASSYTQTPEAELPRSKLSILLVQTEFSTWERARPWSYPGNFAFEEGLTANNVDCFILPALHEFPSSSPLSWLSHARELCAGKRFDQVWVWLVHNEYDEQFLAWIASLAPVRVGVLMESLDYLPEEYIQFPGLRGRRALVERQLRYMTHVLTFDEYDATSFGGRLPVKAIWCPAMLPERYVCQQIDASPNNYAVFRGMIYSRERASFLADPALRGLLAHPDPPENNSPFPRQFEELQREYAQYLQKGLPVSESALADYVGRLRQIRQAIYSLWLDWIRLGCATVNLPALFKSYAGRVVESMAAGRPVISWEVPNRPRTRALFEEGREILLFRRDDPAALAAQIRRIQREPDFARYLAENAREKILRYHTAEARMRKIMDWIATGAEPDYGEKRSPGTTESAAALAAAQSGSSSSHTAVRRTELDQSARTQGEAATQSGALFIKPGYTARSRPEYFVDQLSGVVCQPDVYPIAAYLGQQLGCSHIIDIGCGSAEKLVALYPQFQIIGIDYGANLHLCRQNYPFGQWVELNLETDSAIPVDPAILRRSIIVCADVIEHLIDPTMLLRNIKSLLDHAPVAILTTPERDLTHGSAHLGPPPNPCHVREWNLEELERLLRSNTLNVLVTGLTNNNNIQLRKENSIVFMGNSCIAPSGALLDAIEAVAARWLDRLPQPSLSRYSAERMTEPAPTRVATTAVADHMWPEQVVGYLQQAEAHFVQGDLPAARDALREALVIVPRDPQLIIAYGNIVLRLGDAEDARREFVKATMLAPDHAPAHLNLAGVLLMLGRTAEAEASVRRALALNPTDADALKLLGRLCLGSGRAAEGIEAYASALRQRPNDVETWLVLGKCAVEAGDLNSAQAVYERVLQIEPSNQVARENLGMVMDRVPTEVAGGKPAAFEQAPQPPSPYQRTEPLRGASHTPDRMRLLLVVHGFPPKQIGGTELYAYALAKEFQRRGHAVRVLCPEYGSHHAEGTITHGVCDGLDVARIQVTCGDFIGQFNNERLLPALRRYAVGLAVDLVHIHHLMGISASAPRVFAEHGVPMVMTMHDEWLLCEQCHFLRPDGTFCKDGPETVDKCAHCLVGRSGQSAHSERLPEIFYVLALRRQVLQKTAGLIDTFIVPSQFIGEELSRHGGDHPRMVLSPLGLPAFDSVPWKPRTDRLRFTFLGSICFTKGLDLAIRAFNLTDPNKARLDLYGQVLDAVYFSQAMSYVKPGHQVKYHGPYSAADLPSILAGTDVALIPSRSENYPCVVRESLHAGVPVIAPNVGGVPEIIRDGENGLLFEPGDYEDLARKLCFFVSNPNRVMTFRKRVRPMRTINEDADQLEAIYRDTLARRSDAAEAQVTVTPTSLQEVQACLHRADDYAAKGDWAAAHDALKEAQQRVPDDPQVIVAHGNVLLRLGDVEGARREFVNATALSPEYVPAHNNLAAVLLHLGRLEEAETSARQALALDPANPAALKVLARLYLNSERYTEAIQAYVAILRANPDDLETLLAVGNCYAEAGRPEDAKTFYRRVLQLDPHNAVAAENLAIVEGGGLRSDGAIVRTDGPSDEKQLSVVIVPNGYGLAPLWPSLVQHTNHSLAITILPSTGNGNGADPAHEAACPEGWQVRTGDLSSVRLLNQLAQSSNDDPVILLSSDLILTPGWLKRLLAALKRNPHIAVVGPTSNGGAAPQRVKAEYKGTGKALRQFALRRAHRYGEELAEVDSLTPFCIIFNPAACRPIGPLREDLDLMASLRDYFARLRQAGCTVAVALDAYVHCSESPPHPPDP